jgi:hypothetical protein
MSFTINHNAGFFSNCSVKLHFIIHLFNIFKKTPLINDNNSFLLYKPENIDKNTGIVNCYFNEDTLNNTTIEYKDPVKYGAYFQFINYKLINYKSLIPFLIKYFTPSNDILDIIFNIQTKYNLQYQYQNICVIFYRGNDKSTETKICGYDEFIAKAKLILLKNPNIRFLVQSDETEFIQRCLEEFPNSIVFYDEIRHMPKNSTTSVDYVMRDNIFEFSKNYLAITIIMSKCKYIICGSGNCSIWIMLYRANANNVIQYLNGEWFH